MPVRWLSDPGRQVGGRREGLDPQLSVDEQAGLQLGHHRQPSGQVAELVGHGDPHGAGQVRQAQVEPLPGQERSHQQRRSAGRVVGPAYLEHLGHGQQAANQAEHRGVHLDGRRSPDGGAVRVDPDHRALPRGLGEERLAAVPALERHQAVAVHGGDARTGHPRSPRYPLAMELPVPVLQWMTLPARLTVAAAETTLALGQLVAPDGPVRRRGGYAERAMLLVGEGGYVERLAQSLADPQGPMRLVNVIVDALDPERPLGRAIAPGGPVDRLLDPDGPLFRLLEEGGTVDRLVEPGGLLDRLLTEDGFVEKLVAEGGTLDQLVALGATLERIQPRLGDLAALVPELHASVDALNRAVGPLGDLATRLPGRRRNGAIEA